MNVILVKIWVEKNLSILKSDLWVISSFWSIAKQISKIEKLNTWRIRILALENTRRGEGFKLTKMRIKYTKKCFKILWKTDKVNFMKSIWGVDASRITELSNVYFSLSVFQKISKLYYNLGVIYFFYSEIGLSGVFYPHFWSI